MLAFLEPLEELADYQEIVRKRGKAEGILQIAGCVSSQKTHLMYASVSYTHLTLPTTPYV